MRNVLIGQTDYTIIVRITGTDGAPETGLAHTDIDIAYTRVETDNDVTTSDVTPADLANLTAGHTDWGWEEISSTDHPGLYRLDIADGVFASGAWEAVVTITDASGSDFYAHDIGFRLVNIDPQVTTPPANVTQWNSSNVATPDTAGYPKVTIKSGTGTGEISLSSGLAAADLQAINANTVAADLLALAALCIGSGTVNTGATTSSIPIKTLNSTLHDVDQLVGRVVLFAYNAENGLKLQATVIEAVTLSPDTLTVTALTRAPAEDTAFVIQ